MLKFTLESASGATHICGVDEAGRGPWAGPVVAAAAMFSPELRIKLPRQLRALNDSKKLSPEKREAIFVILPEFIRFGIGIASVEEIDTLNIWGATSLAMKRAVHALPQLPEHALIDGKIHPREFPCRTQTVVGGDGISPSIAAASIMAKVTRDRMMAELAALYPHYGFERHAGYGTPQHQRALADHGVCPIHRRSFAPIRSLLEAA